MASADDVKKLAALARVQVTDAELDAFSKEFESILSYVSQLESLQIAARAAVLDVRNVLRADGEPHETGIYTEALAAQFPERQGNALKVKQIITHD